jgi:hypothetical protein
MQSTKQFISDVRGPVSVGAVHSNGIGEGRRWLRCVLIPIGAAVLLSLAACANQSAVSSPSEPLSVTNNPGAIVRLSEQR